MCTDRLRPHEHQALANHLIGLGHDLPRVLERAAHHFFAGHAPEIAAKLARQHFAL